MPSASVRHDARAGSAGSHQAAGTASIRAAIAADFGTSSLGRRLQLVGVLCWLAYEWGPGNESVTPWILARIISGNSGLVVIPMTAVIGFAFTTAQQLASGFTALAGFSIFARTSRAAWERLRANSSDTLGAWGRLRFGARCALVFGLGTTAVALSQIMSTGETGVRRHASVVVRSAVLCGALVACIGASAASLAVVGRRVTVLSGATELMLRVLGNPLFWLVLLLLGTAARIAKRRFAAQASTLADDGGAAGE